MWKVIFLQNRAFWRLTLVTGMSNEFESWVNYQTRLYFLSYITSAIVTFQLPACFTRMAFWRIASHLRDLVAKILWMLTHLNSSHSSHTQPLHNSHLNTRYLIVELQANLAQNKANTWLNKFNLTISPLWLFHDKTLKHTLNLKCELGTVAKTHSHLTLDYVQLLNHTDKFSWKQ